MVRKAAVAIVIATLAAQTVTAVPLLGRQVSTKVVGGVEAQEREFPYIVSLAKGGSHFCGDPFAGDQVDLSQLGAGGGDTTIFPANLVATLNEIKGKIATVPSFLKGTNNIQASVAATTTKRVPTTERPTRALHERGGQAAAPPSIGGPVAAARRRPPGSRTDVWQSLARVAAAPLGAPRARQVDAQVERLPVVLLGGVPDHVHHQDLAPRAACQCHDAPGGGTPTAHTKQQPGATLAKWSGR
ncbi:hypothetical protein IF1G_10728 [Cordyceps javanica]|uniref:Uncharacterized protein n=1 Tax=Cordyceps javanica TaxID=43265 RepID=A0A545UM87_9HYPO|nr:hypothetical protein IF1G_10728 [Cordyceps javanica]